MNRWLSHPSERYFCFQNQYSICFITGRTEADDEFDMFAQTRSNTFADSRRGFVFVIHHILEVTRLFRNAQCVVYAEDVKFK